MPLPGPTLTRRSLLKFGAGAAALTAAGGYALERATGRSLLRADAGMGNRPIKQFTIMGTDGWVSMPPGAAPAGPQWPDAFAPNTLSQPGRNVYIFGFGLAGRFASPDRLTWADDWNGKVGTPAAEIGGIGALKNRANLTAPVLYFHEGDDIRLTLWNGGLLARPDIVDPHTVHWHGFPNQIPYFDGVPNGSLSVPIGANLVYRFLPYRGMAGSYMWHCHVSDAEHVQMGLQSIVYIRPYQNYGGPGNTQFKGFGSGLVSDPNNPLTLPVADNIPLTRAAWLALRDVGVSESTLGAMPTSKNGGFMGYVFNDGLPPTDPNSTAYHREFAFDLDDIDTRIHWDDSHFAQQDFSNWAPKFFVMNGRAWPDTILGNWDVTVTDPTSGFIYNVATMDQVLNDSRLADASLQASLNQHVDPSTWTLGPNVYTTSDLRLGAQPWSSLIQANAGETIVLRMCNLSYDQFSMTLDGLPFKVIGKDAKSLLQGRDSYYANPNPNDSSFTNFTPRDDISFMAYQTDINVAESRELLVKIPPDAYNSDGSPVIFDFFDRNFTTSSSVTPGGPVAGGLRTQLHVYPPGTLPDQMYPNQVFNPA
jgi:FtsP/CotA-like multicopper oxidase with cupredoxin domain